MSDESFQNDLGDPAHGEKNKKSTKVSEFAFFAASSSVSPPENLPMHIMNCWMIEKISQDPQSDMEKNGS